jgi:glycosyltransferase involved in cell wall biosynthesis
MNNELVSIILPLYNAEKYISETIRSVLQQSYKNWELIVIDDCSTDKSQKIVKDFQRNENRINLIHFEENKGVSEARNKGIEIATGKYIAFIDSDDYWKNSKLEKQINFMKDNNYYFSYTSYEMIDHKGIKLGRKVEVPEKLDFNSLLKGNNIGCFTVMIDRNEINSIKMPKIKHEDFATWLNILRRGYNAYGLKENLGFYRITSDGLTSNKLNSAIWTWKIYKDHLEFSFLKTSYYFLFYIYNSISKHLL